MNISTYENAAFYSLDRLALDDPPVEEDKFHSKNIPSVIDVARFGNGGVEGGSAPQPGSCQRLSDDADEVFSICGYGGLCSQVGEGLGNELGEVLQPLSVGHLGLFPGY